MGSFHLELATKGLYVVVEQGLGILALGHSQLGVREVENASPGQQECCALLTKDNGGDIDQLLEGLHPMWFSVKWLSYCRSLSQHSCRSCCYCCIQCQDSIERL